MDDSLASRKTQLRREALQRRDAIPIGMRIEASYAIAEAAMGHWPQHLGLQIVGGYLPIRSEVDPRPLMALAADRRLRLSVPAVVGSELEFRALDRESDLQPQRLGGHAPGAQAQILLPDIVLVPLAAFDRRGHRIGYGGGFYDRAIARLSEGGRPLATIGLAFAAQEVEAVPDEPFDIGLDLIVTEAGIIRPGA